MGQYYKALVRKAGVDLILTPSDYHSGSKLTEHSWFGDNLISAVCSLIDLYPCQVGWIGDYATDADCPEIIFQAAYKQDNPYEIILPEFKLYSERQGDRGYIVNHSQGKYIDLNQYFDLGSENAWCMHPLPLLTAIGNGLGGGDYYGKNADKVGEWFMNIIEFRQDLGKTASGFENVTEKMIFKE